MTRDKDIVYLCPRCEHHVFAWDSDKKVWVCHWQSCDYTEKHDYDPVDQQMITLFETLRFLVEQAPTTLGSESEAEEKSRLFRELTAIISLKKD